MLVEAIIFELYRNTDLQCFYARNHGKLASKLQFIKR